MRLQGAWAAALRAIPDAAAATAAQVTQALVEIRLLDRAALLMGMTGRWRRSGAAK